MICPSQTSYTPSSVFWACTFQCELNDINFQQYRERHRCNPLTLWQKVGKGVSSPQAQVSLSTGDKSHGRIIHQTISFCKIYQSQKLKTRVLIHCCHLRWGQGLYCSLYWGVSREYTICPIHPMIFQISVSWEVSLTMSFHLCPIYPHNHSFHLGSL